METNHSTSDNRVHQSDAHMHASTMTYQRSTLTLSCIYQLTQAQYLWTHAQESATEHVAAVCSARRHAAHFRPTDHGALAPAA
jgi:hypothetical protein